MAHQGGGRTASARTVERPAEDAAVWPMLLIPTGAIGVMTVLATWMGEYVPGQVCHPEPGTGSLRGPTLGHPTMSPRVCHTPAAAPPPQAPWQIEAEWIIRSVGTGAVLFFAVLLSAVVALAWRRARTDPDFSEDCWALRAVWTLLSSAALVWTAVVLISDTLTAGWARTGYAMLGAGSLVLAPAGLAHLHAHLRSHRKQRHAPWPDPEHRPDEWYRTS
jgi:hypothetical protein